MTMCPRFAPPSKKSRRDEQTQPRGERRARAGQEMAEKTRGQGGIGRRWKGALQNAVGSWFARNIARKVRRRAAHRIRISTMGACEEGDRLNHCDGESEQDWDD